mgnify:CR=1 FL=1
MSDETMLINPMNTPSPTGTGADSLPEVVQKFIRENSDKLRIERLLNEKDLMSGLR